MTSSCDCVVDGRRDATLRLSGRAQSAHRSVDSSSIRRPHTSHGRFASCSGSTVSVSSCLLRILTGVHFLGLFLQWLNMCMLVVVLWGLSDHFSRMRNTVITLSTSPSPTADRLPLSPQSLSLSPDLLSPPDASLCSFTPSIPSTLPIQCSTEFKIKMRSATTDAKSRHCGSTTREAERGPTQWTGIRVMWRVYAQ